MLSRAGRILRTRVGVFLKDLTLHVEYNINKVGGKCREAILFYFGTEKKEVAIGGEKL